MEINKAYLRYEVCTNWFHLNLVSENRKGQRWLAAPLIMEKLDDYSAPAAPTASLDDKACQMLLNELWNAGFRPKDGSGNTGHIEAMKYHLEDMRRLVFKGK